MVLDKKTLIFLVVVLLLVALGFIGFFLSNNTLIGQSTQNTCLNYEISDFNLLCENKLYCTDPAYKTSQCNEKVYYDFDNDGINFLCDPDEKIITFEKMNYFAPELLELAAQDPDCSKYTEEDLTRRCIITKRAAELKELGFTHFGFRPEGFSLSEAETKFNTLITLLRKIGLGIHLSTINPLTKTGKPRGLLLADQWEYSYLDSNENPFNPTNKQLAKFFDAKGFNPFFCPVDEPPACKEDLDCLSCPNNNPDNCRADLATCEKGYCVCDVDKDCTGNCCQFICNRNEDCIENLCTPIKSKSLPPFTYALDPSYSGPLWKNSLNFLEQQISNFKLTSKDLLTFDIEVWTNPNFIDVWEYSPSLKGKIGEKRLLKNSKISQLPPEQFIPLWCAKGKDPKIAYIGYHYEKGNEMYQKIKENNQNPLALFYGEHKGDISKDLPATYYMPPGTGDLPSAPLYLLDDLNALQLALEKEDYSNTIAWISFDTGKKGKFKLSPSNAETAGKMLSDEGIKGVIIYGVSPFTTSLQSSESEFTWEEWKEVARSFIKGFSSKPACLPDCSNKECGPDGCGELCGVCKPESACSKEGQCIVCTDSDGGQNLLVAGTALGLNKTTKELQSGTDYCISNEDSSNKIIMEYSCYEEKGKKYLLSSPLDCPDNTFCVDDGEGAYCKENHCAADSDCPSDFVCLNNFCEDYTSLENKIKQLITAEGLNPEQPLENQAWTIQLISKITHLYKIIEE